MQDPIFILVILRRLLNGNVLLFKQRTIHGGQCSCFDVTTMQFFICHYYNARHTRSSFSDRKFDWKKYSPCLSGNIVQCLSLRKKSTNTPCPIYFVRKILCKINLIVYARATFSCTIEPFVPAITDSNIGSHDSAPIA
jgi:hypothetical protein